MQLDRFIVELFTLQVVQVSGWVRGFKPLSLIFGFQKALKYLTYIVIFPILCYSKRAAALVVSVQRDEHLVLRQSNI